MKLRCSKLPLFFECPSSATEWKHPIDSTGEAAQLGTAIHEALAEMAAGKEPDLVELSNRHSVALTDMERLFAYGKKVWPLLSKHIGTPATEISFDGGGISGTCDVVSTTGPLVVVDWKSGQVYRNHKAQMLGYAALARGGSPHYSGTIKAVIVWLQLGFYEVYDFTEDETDALLSTDIPKLIGDIGRKYSPSADCAFCRGKAECQAKAAYERMACNALTVPVAGELTADRLAALYPQAQLLRRSIDAYDEMLKAALANGPIEIPDGRQIELKKIPKQEILPLEAWPVLVGAGLSQEELAGVITIGKTKLLDAIGSKSSKGMKGKDQALLMGKLKDAGAVNESSFMKIQVSKLQKPKAA